jgi:hypothetical protein
MNGGTPGRPDRAIPSRPFRPGAWRARLAGSEADGRPRRLRRKQATVTAALTRSPDERTIPFPRIPFAQEARIMSLYFFHIVNDARIPDHLGTEFATREAAHAHATDILRRIGEMKLQSPTPFMIQVTDKDDAWLFTV